MLDTFGSLAGWLLDAAAATLGPHTGTLSVAALLAVAWLVRAASIRTAERLGVGPGTLLAIAVIVAAYLSLRLGHRPAPAVWEAREAARARAVRRADARAEGTFDRMTRRGR